MSLKKYREINEYQNSIWNVIFLTRKVQQITSCSAIVYVFLQGVVTANKPRKAASIWKQQLLGWKTKTQIKHYCRLVLSSPRLNGNKAKRFQSNLLKQIFTQLWFTGKQFIAFPVKQSYKMISVSAAFPTVTILCNTKCYSTCRPRKETKGEQTMKKTITKIKNFAAAMIRTDWKVVSWETFRTFPECWMSDVITKTAGKQNDNQWKYAPLWGTEKHRYSLSIIKGAYLFFNMKAL